MDFGIYDDIPNEEYQADPAVSCSYLKKHGVNPRKARFGERNETPALVLGSLLHTAILEPAALLERYYPTKLERISEREKATQAEMVLAAGRDLVKVADYDEARRIAEVVWKHPVAGEIIQPDAIKIERSFWWEDGATGLSCRSRADIIHPGFRMIADIKTAAEAEADPFSKAMARYKYHWQEAMYREGYELAGGFRPAAFVFIVVEKELPYEVVTYELDTYDVERGHEAVHAALQSYAECLKNDVWPGYGPDTLQPISLPGWAHGKVSSFA